MLAIHRNSRASLNQYRSAQSERLARGWRDGTEQCPSQARPEVDCTGRRRGNNRSTPKENATPLLGASIDIGQQSSHCDAAKEERLIAAMQNSAMDTDLTAVKAALADISDTELAALITATNGVPQIPYGLLIWIEGACDRPVRG